MTKQITLPWPPKQLSPNCRQHWAQKAKHVRSYRSICAGLTLESRGRLPKLPNSGEIALLVTFCPPDNRHRDRDNMIASLKAGFDGIATALGVDDVRFVSTFRVGDSVKDGCVLVSFGGEA